MKWIKQLNIFEWVIIVVATIINVFLVAIDPQSGFLGLIASITGVVCVVLTAKGHISCYLFGIINIVSYILIAINSKYYGELILNAVYYLPMQFYGIALWRKNLNGDDNIVKAKKISKETFVICTILTFIGVIGLSLLLMILQGTLPIIDSMSSIFSLTAMWLSVQRYKEQWLLWIIINIISVGMWVFAAIRGDANSLSMIIMWGSYLVNAFYGYYTWSKLENVEETISSDIAITN